MVAAVASEEPQTAVLEHGDGAVAPGDVHPVGGGEEPLGDARSRQDIAHEDEQGHDRERIVEPGFEHRIADHRPRRPPAAHQREADAADERHGESDGNAREDQREKNRECNQGKGHGAVLGNTIMTAETAQLSAARKASGAIGNASEALRVPSSICETPRRARRHAK